MRRRRDCSRILDKALNAREPVLIEAVVDPYKPPMPPKLSLDQSARLLAIQDGWSLRRAS